MRPPRYLEALGGGWEVMSKHITQKCVCVPPPTHGGVLVLAQSPLAVSLTRRMIFGVPG